MRSHTVAITIAAPPHQVFDFVSLPENLPRWAVNLASAVQRREGRYFVVSPAGEREIAIRADADCGVVDYVIGDGQRQVVIPSRVVANGDGCEYLFTVFLRPDLAPEEVERRLSGIRQELDVLRGLFA